jgi:hypothetical protein
LAFDTNLGAHQERSNICDQQKGGYKPLFLFPRFSYFCVSLINE